MSSARQPPAAEETSTWLTCAQASDLLGVSENTIRMWARRGKLHPLRARRVHPSGANRELEVYDPHELAAMGSRRRLASIPNDPGELAARAFEMFDLGRSQREIVVALRESPTRVAELHDQWIDLGGSEIVVGRAAQDELERFVGPFSGVADLCRRVRELLGDRIEISLGGEETALERASDAQVEVAIAAVLDDAEDRASDPAAAD